METEGKSITGDLKALRLKLDAWRSNRRKGERIPKELWQKATEVARQRGVQTVSKALGLSHTDLKHRVLNIDCQTMARSFVEVKPSIIPDAHSCIVELEKSNGTRLRICSKATSVVDWDRIKDVFLGA